MCKDSEFPQSQAELRNRLCELISNDISKKDLITIRSAINEIDFLQAKVEQITVMYCPHWMQKHIV